MSILAYIRNVNQITSHIFNLYIFYIYIQTDYVSLSVNIADSRLSILYYFKGCAIGFSTLNTDVKFKISHSKRAIYVCVNCLNCADSNIVTVFTSERLTFIYI